MTITRVQGNAKGTTTSNSMSVTLSQAPTQGNVLVAVIGGWAGGANPYVTSVTQTGVTWYQAIITPSDPNLFCEIYYGIVGSNPSNSISINFNVSMSSGAVADVCEYSGITTSSPLDKTANNAATESTSTSTGVTSTTSQANELWIGGIMGITYSQNSPTNGFTLLDGTLYSGVSVAYLEKIVSSTGTATSGTTLGGYEYWLGCIATFKAASGGGSASKLAYTAGAGQTVTASSISSVITVQVQDSNGNPVTTGATVSLSASSTGGTFYADSGGTNQITSLIIASGQSSANFYYKDANIGAPTLIASSSGLTSATTQFTIYEVSYNGLYSGAGSKQTTISYTGSGVLVQVDSNATNVNSNAVIENLIIDGQNQPNTIGIQLQDVSNCIIRNVTIMNCNTGIHLFAIQNSMQGNRLEHIRFINCNNAIFFDGYGNGNFYFTTIDDVGISEPNNNSNAIGILVGQSGQQNVKLYSAFIKANVWLGDSNSTAMTVNGQIKYSIVNLEVEENLSTETGIALQVNSGAYVTNNQNFLLTTGFIQSQNVVKGSGIDSTLVTQTL